MIEDVTCPTCGGPMVPRISARGAFWGCKKFPHCRGTRDVDGDVRSPSARQFVEKDERDDQLPSDARRANDQRRWRS